MHQTALQFARPSSFPSEFLGVSPDSFYMDLGCLAFAQSCDYEGRALATVCDRIADPRAATAQSHRSDGLPTGVGSGDQRLCLGR